MGFKRDVLFNINVTNEYLRYTTLILSNPVKYNHYGLDMSSRFRTP